MKIKNLLLLFSTMLFASLDTIASSPTDYFQSSTVGNWSAISTWQSSASSSGPWVASDLVPTNNSPGVFIRSGTTVTIDAAATAQALTIDAGGVLIQPGGIDLTIVDGVNTYDFIINGRYEINGRMPIYSGTAPKIWNAGEVRVNSNAGGQSDNFAQDPHAYFGTGSLFNWNTNSTFGSVGVTYFPNAGASDKTIFLVSKNTPTIGSNSPTTFNCKFEVANGVSISFQNTGAKVFRDGLGGGGTIVHAGTDCGPFQITGPTAVIDGSLTINLEHSAGNAFEISSGATVSVTGSPNVHVGTSLHPNALMRVAGELIHNGSNPIDLSYASLLTIDGTISGNGTFTTSPTTSLVVGPGSVSSVVYLTSGGTNNYLKNLTVNGTLTLGNAVNMPAGTNVGTVSVSSMGVLNANGFLDLKSDANGTARVGVSAGTIHGNSTVERYISAGKKWRLLSPGPFSDIGQSINAAWQEGFSNPTSDCASNGGTPGYGTILFYNNTGGYDYASTSLPNIKTFISDGSAFAAPSSTTGVALATYQGYFVFIYGDRQICTSGPVVATSTTLRSRGVLNIGPVTITLTGLVPGGYYFVRNPYASSVDVTNVLVRSTGIANMVEIWDPNAHGTYGYGQYVTASGNTIIGATPNFPDAATVRILHSGQACIVQATSSTATIQFIEADKTTTESSGVFLRTVPSMNINLFSSGTPIDEVAIRLTGDTSILKVATTSNNTNLFLQEGTRMFAIQSKVPAESDTFFLELRGLFPQKYRLNFTQMYFAQKKTRLIDIFTGTDSVVNSSMEYDFTVTNDTNSYAHRFMLITKDTQEIVIKDSIMKIYPNPVRDLITLSGPSFAGPANIVDISGKVVRDINVISNTANCSFLKNGIYFLRVRNKMFKFIKL